jgi:TRAP-type C4-dicarboxylate transport system permease small subunit
MLPCGAVEPEQGAAEGWREGTLVGVPLVVAVADRKARRFASPVVGAGVVLCGGIFESQCGK